jgi:dTDP-4-dehydrorhamnose reductase
MKVLITGAGGQAGRELQQTAPAGLELICLARQQLDITDRQAVSAVMQAIRPDLVINGAAYTAVDTAETEPERANAVNGAGAANLARAAVDVGARFFHLSTDFVFDGQKSSPYLESDPTGPLGVYGRSKLAGEQKVRDLTGGAALIVRTGWLYSAHGNNFVKTMLRLLRERQSLAVVTDQVGTPTWTRTLTEALWAAAQKPRLRGTYHWSDAGVASWYDFAVAIQEEGLQLELLPDAIPIRPINTSEYPTPARRPAYSVLDKTAAWRDFGLAGRHWRICLRQMMQELKK